ncbi:GNAT family N-acetyltransferase [Amycolatopsis sp. MtRt-6]|uniref:GNAT family N-acetyltransferase n=1 Tax=Amycolatopsis sp. MtRt-6 TaxID=2792782 RepID=UPI001A8CD581|nr:GNAT family N-acetyltransferase [Amycolatopsis sp. MtRt-6]
MNRAAPDRAAPAAPQRAHHERNFDASHTRIITVDGHDAGVLTVLDGGPEVVLGLIEIDPAYQSRGIGGHVVRALADEAASRAQDVVRLGFVETGRPREHKIALRYTAP